MFAFLEAVFALVGVAALTAGCGLALWLWLAEQIDSPPVSDDPYRQGLDAAARISAMAWQTEQALHHVAHQPADKET